MARKTDCQLRNLKIPKTILIRIRRVFVIFVIAPVIFPVYYFSIVVPIWASGDGIGLVLRSYTGLRKKYNLKYS